MNHCRANALLACVVLFVVAALSGCAETRQFERREQAKAVQYRSEMVSLISDLRSYARTKQPSFEVMGNNGLELFATQGSYGASEVKRLLDNVDGVIMEEYNYGWEMKDDEKTPKRVQRELAEYLRAPLQAGLPVLNIDYCESPAKMRKAYALSEEAGFVGFSADSRQLDTIPERPQPLHREHADTVRRLKEIQNFLVLLNPQYFRDKQSYVAALRDTNYDLLIIDLTFNGEPLTKAEVASLRRKANGGGRLVFCYVSVGEAEEYRPYWKEAWHDRPPAWIAAENEDWEGNFKVKYWTQEWRRLLFGGEAAYLDQVLAAGFDGAFLDVIDAFHYFESSQGK